MPDMLGPLYGVIIADTSGSRYEFNNCYNTDFDLLPQAQPGVNANMAVAKSGNYGRPGTCFTTDDSIHTLAVAKALLEWKKSGKTKDLAKLTLQYLVEFTKVYPHARYGGMVTREWLGVKSTQTIVAELSKKPRNSFGNGAAMRVAAVAWAAENLEEAKKLAKEVTRLTHNSVEGLHMAEAVAVAVFLAKEGHSKSEIRRRMAEYYPELNDPYFTPSKFRATRGTYRSQAQYRQQFLYKDIQDGQYKYKYDDLTVPMAIAAFLDSNSYEEAVKNAISMGGDSDTVAAICGGIAEAAYGVPVKLKERVREYLDHDLRCVLDGFGKAFPNQKWEDQIKKSRKNSCLPDRTPPRVDKPDPTAEEGKWILDVWDEIQKQHRPLLTKYGNQKIPFSCPLPQKDHSYAAVYFVGTPIEDKGSLQGWIYSTLNADVSHTFIWLKPYGNRLFYKKSALDIGNKGSVAYEKVDSYCWAPQNKLMQVFDRQNGGKFPSMIIQKDGEFQRIDYYTPTGKIREKAMSVKVGKKYAIQARYLPGSETVECFERVRLRTQPPVIVKLQPPGIDSSVKNLPNALKYLANLHPRQTQDQLQKQQALLPHQQKPQTPYQMPPNGYGCQQAHQQKPQPLYQTSPYGYQQPLQQGYGQPLQQIYHQGKQNQLQNQQVPLPYQQKPFYQTPPNWYGYQQPYQQKPLYQIPLQGYGYQQLLQHPYHQPLQQGYYQPLQQGGYWPVHKYI